MFRRRPPPTTPLGQSMKSFTSVFDAVEQNFADKVDADKAVYNGAIPGMLRTLDPHSNFFDPKAYAALREDQRGQYYGVGMQVGPRNGKTMVMWPFESSPAYRAGLRPGDMIIQVNDKKTEGLNTSEIAELLKVRAAPRSRSPSIAKAIRSPSASTSFATRLRGPASRRPSG